MLRKKSRLCKKMLDLLGLKLGVRRWVRMQLEARRLIGRREMTVTSCPTLADFKQHSAVPAQPHPSHPKRNLKRRPNP